MITDGDAELPLTKSMSTKLYQVLMETDVETTTDGNTLINDDKNGVMMLPPLLDATSLNLISKKNIEVFQLSGTDGFSLLKNVQNSINEINRINAKHLMLTVPVTANVKQQDLMCRNAVASVAERLTLSGNFTCGHCSVLNAFIIRT